ncbi:HEPN domain-containing protein [Paenibacillus sepulcri]|uniref:HEPN domain-containing protein n=1 Tax=Paenibacillus sepulcri TaxID=359917 RepID=A0ABS7BW39_9BACL|nr:HEPN domain-containing protein [Paenibacillus sepulcri]
MERLDEWFSLSQSLLLSPQYWHDISQRYMDSAAIFLNHGMYEQCESVAGMAVNAMLKAFYLKENGILPEIPHISDVWISNAHLLANINAGIYRCPNAICLQYHTSDMKMTYESSEEQTKILFGKSDFFLCQLSPRVVEAGAVPYNSVL